MALSAIEDRYLSTLTEREFPTFTPEESAMAAPEGVDGMQLAAGPSATMSDAGGGRGSYAGYDPRQDAASKAPMAEIKPYDPTVRERLAGFLQAGFEGIGIDRYKARQNAETILGGPSSNLPLNIGLADFVPFLGTGLQTQEAVRMGEEAVTSAQQGNLGTAALQAGGAALGLVPGAIGTVKAGKGLANMAGEELNRAILEGTGPLAAVVPQSARPLFAVPTEQFPKVATQMAAKVDKGTVKISDKVTQGQVLQLSPEYRVKVSGFKPEGKTQNIPNVVNPGNYADTAVRLDSLSQAFPDPLESPERFSSMLATVYNSTEVPIPPRWMIDNVNDMGKWSSWFGTMTKGQLDEANRGFSVVDKFKDIYTNGQASADTTGRLMMWAMLSRRASAYPHESGFLDLAEPMTPLIQKALRGEYGPADVEAGLKLIKQSIPAGSPGNMVTSNANDFLRVFLPKMSEKLPDGRTKLQALHEMIADPSMTGPDIRREFYGLAQDVGIKNKVLSFALLVSGREDVMVLDRIQINRLFAGGEKIYDDVAHLFDGGPGLAIYEGLERSLGKRVNELYTNVGRGDQASLGRYHWESWVLSSGQEVAHPTLETIVKSAKGEANAFANVPVKEGRMHERAFNVTYERTPDGKNRFIFPTASGEQFEFTKPALDELFGQVMDKKNGIIPKDFPGVKFFSKDTLEDGSPNSYFGKPWYSWPGVNRERIDELAATFGTKLDPSAGGTAVEGTGAGKAAGRSVRATPKAGTKQAVNRGRSAPTKGAN
jgi:hypothetical protein